MRRLPGGSVVPELRLGADRPGRGSATGEGHLAVGARAAGLRGAAAIVCAAIVCAAVLALAGCSSATDVTFGAGDPVSPSESAASGAGPAADVPADLRASLPQCPRSEPLPAVTGGLPAVELACLGPGDPVLLSGLRGTPLIVNAWASWCQPCRTELPALASFSSQSSGEVSVLGLDVADDPTAAAQLWDELRLPFASVTDPDSLTRPGMSWIGLPVTYFVDADGVVVYRHAGAITEVEVWQALAAEHLGTG